MTFIFTSNHEVIEGLVKTLQSNGYAMSDRIRLLGYRHDKGYSTAQIQLIGELTDLIFLGLYTQSTIDRDKQKP